MKGRNDSVADHAFQLNFQAWFAEQEVLAESAWNKSLRTCTLPNLWNTVEVKERLSQLTFRIVAQQDAMLPGCLNDSLFTTETPTVEEYCSLRTLEMAENFDGIAAAGVTKPRRAIDFDKTVPERPLGYDASGGCATDAPEDPGHKKRFCMDGMTGSSAHLLRLDGELLDKVVGYQARERFTLFSRDLMNSSFLQEGKLPLPEESRALSERRRALHQNDIEPYGSDCPGDAGRLLNAIDERTLVHIVQMQREAFKMKAKDISNDDDSDSDMDAPPVQRIDCEEQPAVARFADQERWSKPSDYVAHLAAQFEAGMTTPPGKRKFKKTLTQNQVRFLAGFAKAVNEVWSDEQDEKPHHQRRRHDLLLIGEGGSGKTAIVQDIVLTTIDFLWPPTSNDIDGSSSVIACFSWAQAENISTTRHKATTCHAASAMRVQSMRNSAMQPGEKLGLLKQKWADKRLLVLEEISMISPALYNMILYRSFWGRKAAWNVEENIYNTVTGAFGRMPLVIMLGDSLQLQPTNSPSLLDDLNLVQSTSEKSFPAEHQRAQRLFLQTAACYQLTESNRFRGDPQMQEMLSFMRSPDKTLPESVKQAWGSI